MSADPLPMLASDPICRSLFRYQKARRERLTVESHLMSVSEQLQVDDLVETERQAGMALVDLLIQDLGFCYWIGGRDEWHPDDWVILTDPTRPSSVAEAVTAIDLDTD